MMVERGILRKDTRLDLRDAAIRVGVRDGIHSGSIRMIAREAGVSEGAVYKHFESKDALIRDAYTAIVEEMARDKSVLLKVDLPFEYAVRAWVKLTYEYFDGNRDAFSYVLLMPHRMAETLGKIYTVQGEMFLEFYLQAQEKGEAKLMEPGLALALFTGCVLNIPRLINDGGLEGPALRYAEEVAEVVLQIFSVTG
ncbi:MAG: TetR/AcrR family transcriptional regulator [Phycisphaerales bacterium]|nr:TetR/AcrR family transcriptional regulator [Phycisphaerales bacterium]